MTTLTSTTTSSPADIMPFIRLLKPRVMSLVVFSGWAGLVMAPGHLHPFLGSVALACIAIAAGGAAAINMWYERDIDAVMRRTQNRPLPQGHIAPAEALSFGIVLNILAVFLMGLALNWMAAGLLAFASAFYVFVYTIWLKRRTPQNIVIGGAAGAFPPLIGWAAVTGSIDLFPCLLFLLIFFWTPPHFWALALHSNEDYRRAQLPMLPVIAGADVTTLHMLIYTLILTPFVMAPYALDYTGPLYLTGALILHAIFLFHAVTVRRNPTTKNGRRMFAYSIVYLFALFTLMMIDKIR